MSSSPGSAPEVALSVAQAANAVGLSTATVRTWDHRYGLSPSLRTPGGHRRYSLADLERVQLVTRLVDEGVPPSSAVPTVVHMSSAQCKERLAQSPTHGTTHSAIAAPQSHQAALMRACRALDGDSIRLLVTALVEAAGVIATWNQVIEPVLLQIGLQSEAGGLGVEAEHSASAGITEALSAISQDQASKRPVLLAGAPEEQHVLALLALRAALSEREVPTNFLGPRVPNAALQAAVKRLRPRAVIIWSSTHQTAELADLDKFAGQRPPVKIWLAGPGWTSAHRDAHLHLDSLAGAVDVLSNPRG